MQLLLGRTGVVGGAVTGHGVATAIAIMGGNVLSKYVSEKTVQYMRERLLLLLCRFPLGLRSHALLVKEDLRHMPCWLQRTCVMPDAGA